jgi:hypothetical protein
MQEKKKKVPRKEQEQTLPLSLHLTADLYTPGDRKTDGISTETGEEVKRWSWFRVRSYLEEQAGDLKGLRNWDGRSDSQSHHSGRRRQTVGQKLQGTKPKVHT